MTCWFNLVGLLKLILYIFKIFGVYNYSSKTDESGSTSNIYKNIYKNC